VSERTRNSRTDNSGGEGDLLTGIRKVLEHPIGRNASALYSAQVATYLFPLLTTPFLARVLGPHSWGLIIFSLAFAGWVTVIIEYGFDLSATRELARLRGDAAGISDIAAGVLGAKTLLVIASLIITLVATLVVPLLRANLPYLAWGWLLAVSQGLFPGWYFQGIEKMRPLALLTFGSKALVTLGIFLVIRQPEDGWKILALYALASLVATAAATYLLYRKVTFRLPGRARTRLSLTNSSSMFLYRGAVSLYTTANALVLGLVASPASVAFFGGAERISKALTTLTQPVSQAIFPRISSLLESKPERASRLIRLSLGAMSALGSFLGVGLFFASPLIVRLLLGRGFETTVPVLRVLSLTLPLIAISNVLGLQWLVPLGKDGVFNRIIISAGLLNLALAVTLGLRFGALGMAWAVVLAELFVTFTMAVVVWRDRRIPVRVGRNEVPHEG